MATTFNENIEAQVISCLLKDGSLYYSVEDVLEKDAFAWKPYGIIFQSIRDVVDADLFPDIETITADLDRKDKLQSVMVFGGTLRGREALEHLKSLDANPDAIESYSIQVNDFYGNRQLLKLSDDIERYVRDGKRPVETVGMTDLETGRISSYVGATSKNIRTSKEVSISNIEQLEKTRKGESRYIPSGFDFWDYYFGGIAPRLYMIAAEQNEGKSTLVINLIHNTAIKSPKENLPFVPRKVQLFTFESSGEEINNKLAQLLTGIDQIRIEKGELSDSEIVEYASAMNKIGNAKIMYDDSPEISLPLLHTKIRKAVANGAEIIFIDQLEQISLPGSGDFNQQEHIKLNYITYKLKAYQREQDVPIIVVHQRKKVEEKNQKGETVLRDPELNSLNQAGGKAPDGVLMLRTKADPSVFCVKNRQGRKGARKIGWNPSRLKFYDIPQGGNAPEFAQGEMYDEE